MKTSIIPVAEPDSRPAETHVQVLLLIDIVVQISLLVLAMMPLPELSFNLAGRYVDLHYAPIVIWQTISLICAAVAKEGEPGFRFHTGGFWPVVLMLIFGIVLIPIRLGYFILWVWYMAARLFSIPYLLITIAAFIRSLRRPGGVRRTIALRHLILIRQSDLLLQLGCLLVPFLITIHNHRPLAEALTLGYPLLAVCQLLSLLLNLVLWGSLRPWRSSARIPHLVLYGIFLTAALTELLTAGSASWHELLRNSSGQVLTAAYLLITILEWDAIHNAARPRLQDNPTH